MAKLLSKKLLSFALFILFVLLIVILGANLLQHHSVERQTATTSSTPAVKMNKSNGVQDSKTIDLKPEASLASGWMTYTVPTGCYSFSLPPDSKPSYTLWKAEDNDPNKCPGHIDVVFENNDTIEIATGVGGHEVPATVQITRSHILLDGNNYELMKLTEDEHANPYKIVVNPIDPKQFYTLPTILLDARPMNSNRSGDLNESEVTLFNTFLLTLKFPTKITPTPHEWKHYTNNNYHFSLQYPEYLTTVIDTLPSKATEFGTTQDMLRFTTASYMPDFQIHVNPHFDGPGSPGVVYEMIYKYNRIGFTKKDNPSSHPNTDPLRTLVGLLHLSADKTFMFTFTYNSNDKSHNYEADFDQILTSLQFLNN